MNKAASDSSGRPQAMEGGNLAEVRWIKIVTDIFDDEKILLIESMPEADSIIVIWFKLLCLAGKQNNSGVFVMSNGIPYTEAMLATVFRRKETVITLALHTFQQFGMIEIIDNTVTIPKWGKHQNFDQIEVKKEYQRKYMQEYRERQKLLAEQKPQDITCDDSKGQRKSQRKTNGKANVSSLDKIRIDKNREDKSIRILGHEPVAVEVIPTEFLAFWDAYPKKVKKAVAQKAWVKVNASAHLDAILDAVAKAKDSREWRKDNGQYIPHPSTWLNQRRWEDETQTAPQESTFLEIAREEYEHEQS